MTGVQFPCAVGAHQNCLSTSASCGCHCHRKGWQKHAATITNQLYDLAWSLWDRLLDKLLDLWEIPVEPRYSDPLIGHKMSTPPPPMASAVAEPPVEPVPPPAPGGSHNPSVGAIADRVATGDGQTAQSVENPEAPGARATASNSPTDYDGDSRCLDTLRQQIEQFCDTHPRIATQLFGREHAP